MSQEPGRTIAEIGEFSLIARLQRRFERAGIGVVRGIGDDTAVLQVAPGRVLLATTDSAVEGVHFRRSTISATDLGRRILAVNLSDIAAMGGQPRWALVSLDLPPNLPVEFVEELADGMGREAEKYGAVVVGGNVARSPDHVVIDVTLLGEVEPGRALYRNGARPGDRILVTGTLGDAAAGLAVLLGAAVVPGQIAGLLVERHRRPTARVEVGRAIAVSGLATAMIDLSDGLASDLAHLAEASHVGAVVEEDRIPVSPEMREAARLTGVDPMAWAIGGGEDYELLVTVPPRGSRRLIEEVMTLGVLVSDVGEITSDGNTLLVRTDGSLAGLGSARWQHFPIDQAPSCDDP